MTPRDDDPWRRRREREEEEEAERQEILVKDNSNAKLGSISAGTDKIQELCQRAEVLIEQVNNLYNQYLSGAEKRPPIERRKQLDQIMSTLMVMGKPTPSIQFRCSNLQSNFISYRDRWDKMMKDLEAGKLKRR